MPYRILTFSLALMLLFNGMGVFVFTYAKVGFHRAFDLSSNISEKSQTLVMNELEFSSLSWVGKRDFIYKGMVFDYTEISKSNGKVFIKCIGDSEETVLKNSMTTNFDDSNKNTAPTHAGKNLFKIFPVFPCFDYCFAIEGMNSNLYDFNLFSRNHISTVDLDLISPPPKVG